MNAVEIEEAVSLLAEQPFNPENFPYAFLEAFGNKETTIKRLRAGASNKSDLGGVLQTNNIHIATCNAGEVTRTLNALRESPATAKAKAKFILATDGVDFEAEESSSGETVACAYKDFPDHFGFFLALAGISTVRQIAENSFDIRATSRLNRLYLELRKDNPDWETGERRHDMNHFMARLIFCFFAEDTGIFNSDLFTGTVEQMCDRDSSNTHDVIRTLFIAMNTPTEDRTAANIPRWAIGFPYVNGGLFSGNLDVPRFSKMSRSYLLHIGNLDWRKINPDIFGSMIQAVAEDADDDDRRQLGMHYTSVPNILKVLNPLFLDDLRAKLVEAGDNHRMLLNLRNRMARIRVFDPACGSGNFLVIAYKEMRAIEATINERRGELEHRSVIPKTNFRGIEIRDFPAEVARLALVIAEYQCDVLYRGHNLALAEFLPLDRQNWITCGNALRLDWLSICPPTGTGVKLQADDLFSTPLEQAQIEFENEGGETYICGNRVHIVAMTGSYFRGDAEAILDPVDESKFETVTYTYYEQLNGYEYLKQLDIGYYFYSGSYTDEILSVLDPAKKTIVHIPNVNSRESTQDKIKEVEHIIGEMGEWQGTDPTTGFQLVKIPSGKVLRIADLVEDDPARRDRVVTALKDPAQKFNRDHVDIIIALGMAKEGFDWIWCEHALTVGYRSSLTEIVQIIGRVTRDAEGKTTAQFTNLIAEPDAAEGAVSEAVNDTLKAIAASLLMEQVLAPRFEFRPKNPENRPTPGYEYGEGGYLDNKCNVGVNEQTGAIQVEIKGLTLPRSKEATRICQEDLNEVIAAFVQDRPTIERGLFDEELVPEELTQMRMGKIVKDKYPELDAEDQEAVRQHAIAALNFTQQAKQRSGGGGDEPTANTALIEGVRRFAMDVRELDIDLIDRINPFGEAYAILAKTMSEDSLRHVAAAISAKRTALTPDEAKALAVRALRFKKERGRVPSPTAPDPWERKMAEGAAAFLRFDKEGRYA